jgi:transcriptional regulator of acetoin/glycerol metabolism
VTDLPGTVQNGNSKIRVARESSEESPLGYEQAKDLAMGEFMREYLDRLLDAHGGNVSTASRTAGVSRRTVHRWLAEYRQAGTNGGSHEA